MTVCDDAEHDEIVYDEQRMRGMKIPCPACRLVAEIAERDGQIVDLEEALKTAKSPE